VIHFAEWRAPFHGCSSPSSEQRATPMKAFRWWEPIKELAWRIRAEWACLAKHRIL
jgi:hypothetical protein